MKRTCLLATSGLLIALLLGGPAFYPGVAGEPAEGTKGSSPPRRSRGPVRLAEEGLRIHREAIVVDGHNDLPWQFREKGDLSFHVIDLRRPQKGLHTDIPRL